MACLPQALVPNIKLSADCICILCVIEGTRETLTQYKGDEHDGKAQEGYDPLMLD